MPEELNLSQRAPWPVRSGPRRVFRTHDTGYGALRTGHRMTHFALRTFSEAGAKPVVSDPYRRLSGTFSKEISRPRYASSPLHLEGPK